MCGHDTAAAGPCSRRLLPALPPANAAPWRRPRPRAGASVGLFCSVLESALQRWCYWPCFPDDEPKVQRHLCSFLRWPQFKVDMGFHPGAGQLLPAVAIVPRGGTAEICYPENACPPPPSAKELFLCPVLVPRAPTMPHNSSLPVSLAASISPSFGSLCESCKNGQRCLNSISSFIL